MTSNTKSDSVNQCIFNWRTTWENFISSRSNLKWRRQAFLEDGHPPPQQDEYCNMIISDQFLIKSDITGTWTLSNTNKVYHYVHPIIKLSTNTVLGHSGRYFPKWVTTPFHSIPFILNQATITWPINTATQRTNTVTLILHPNPISEAFLKTVTPSKCNNKTSSDMRSVPDLKSHITGTWTFTIRNKVHHYVHPIIKVQSVHSTNAVHGHTSQPIL